MSAPAREAFDNCPSRTTRDDGSSYYAIVCPRYTDGFDVLKSSSVFVDNYKRSALAMKMGCVACPHRVKGPEQASNQFEGYHEAIVENCQSKFESRHYDDAVFTGILVVRDRLRELTGYENATDAFGRGGLIIAGSANSYTDNNFQEGAKFIMLANDKFRNELAHTNDQNDLIKKPALALQFLGMSSISMFMLDTATATNSKKQN